MALCKALIIASTSMAIIVGALLLPATASANNHVVGETDGWKLGVNYEYWASANGNIPVGDTLEFIYDAASYNVVMVDEDSYNSCIVPSNAQMWNDGHDFLLFEIAGKFFFICGMGDHCSRGMKLTITTI